MLGFDTLYSNTITDEEIRDLAHAEGRIVLTRDRELLKRREITHGCFVHALKPSQQLREIVQRLQLESHVFVDTESLPSFPRGGAPGRCPGQGPATGWFAEEATFLPAPNLSPPSQGGVAPRVAARGRVPRRGGSRRRSARAPVHAVSALQLAAHAGDKDESLARLPERVAAHYQTFSVCTRCERVFWEGSHWHRMRAMLCRPSVPTARVNARQPLRPGEVFSRREPLQDYLAETDYASSSTLRRFARGVELVPSMGRGWEKRCTLSCSSRRPSTPPTLRWTVASRPAAV